MGKGDEMGGVTRRYGKRVDGFAGSCVPDLDDAVHAAGGEQVAVARPGEGANAFAMAIERQACLAFFHVPEANKRLMRGGGNGLAVGREDGAMAIGLVAAEAGDLLGGVNVPDANGLIDAGGDGALAVGREGDGGDGAGVSVQA